MEGGGGGAAPGAGGTRTTSKLVEMDDADASVSEGIDSPVYDGDVESAPAAGSTQPIPIGQHRGGPTYIPMPTGAQSGSVTSFTLPADSEGEPTPGSGGGGAIGSHRLPTPKASRMALRPDYMNEPIPNSNPSSSTSHLLHLAPSTAAHRFDVGPPKMYVRPTLASVDDIRAFVRRAIEGNGMEDGIYRDWKTAEPPQDRPVRIYADGVYDLFHFGHALQLRQAKLSFPNVHLIVGVCSDELCREHKSGPAMTHAERMESVDNCKWTDEVAADAPWMIDQAWLDKWEIDYVAHDEEVYPTKAVDDVYDFVKRQGKFLPTRRTPSISTSDLLERVVRGYRDGFFDSKLEKNGHPELMASDVDWDSSGSVEKVRAREKRKAAAEAAKARSASGSHHHHRATALSQNTLLPSSTPS